MLLLALFLFLPAEVLAGTPQYTVAGDYWAPFRTPGAGGGMDGTDAALLREVGRRMGIEFQWQQFPWARCLRNLRLGKSDIMTGVARTPEREPYMLFSSRPYATCAISFYALREKGIHLNGYGDLKGLRIGYTRDSVYFPRFDKDDTLQKYAVDGEDRLLQMLLADRLDVIVGTRCQVANDLARLGLEDRVELLPYAPEGRVALYVAVSRLSSLAARMTELDGTLDAMVREGLLPDLSSCVPRHASDAQPTCSLAD